MQQLYLYFNLSRDMVNAVFEFEFNNQVIEFDISDKDLMINATEMGKIFGKNPAEFLKLKQTKDFIEELKNLPLPFNETNEERSYADNQADLESMIFVNKIDGLWMCEILALKFAGWLNPKFEVWVYSTIREFLPNLRDNNEAYKQIVKFEDQLEKLVKKLQGNADFQSYMLLQEKLKKLPYRIKRNNQATLRQYRQLKAI
ncbi:KilA-N domain-containing protein [Mucilaginibacter sp. Mucisp86]|uniref:KilA-N domain-containing protein n=1 Tax=Mucilaginibacter sp. Mucisp86 TaxID=3243060 RepID=UPI0039B65D2D